MLWRVSGSEGLLHRRNCSFPVTYLGAYFLGGIGTYLCFNGH